MRSRTTQLVEFAALACILAQVLMFSAGSWHVHEGDCDERPAQQDCPVCDQIVHGKTLGLPEAQPGFTPAQAPPQPRALAHEAPARLIALPTRARAPPTAIPV